MTKIRLSALVGKKNQYGKMSLLRLLSDFYHRIQSPAKYFDGDLRVYKPDDDSNPAEIEPPSETKMKEILQESMRLALFDAASKIDEMGSVDFGNIKALADVKVDGATLIEQAPIPLLVWLEKNLKDMITILEKLPTLDPSKHWEKDETTGHWVSGPHETKRTRKVTRGIVLSPATEKHPAQVKEVTNDERVGVWVDTFTTSRLTEVQRRELLDRAEKVLAAVIAAKEEANSIYVDLKHPGTAVMEYILDGAVF